MGVESEKNVYACAPVSLPCMAWHLYMQVTGKLENVAIFQLEFTSWPSNRAIRMVAIGRPGARHTRVPALAYSRGGRVFSGDGNAAIPP